MIVIRVCVCMAELSQHKGAFSVLSVNNLMFLFMCYDIIALAKTINDYYLLGIFAVSLPHPHAHIRYFDHVVHGCIAGLYVRVCVKVVVLILGVVSVCIHIKMLAVCFFLRLCVSLAHLSYFLSLVHDFFVHISIFIVR